MRKRYVIGLLLLLGLALAAGCGGGGSTTNACIKNPWAPGCSSDTGGSTTATITGRVLIDGGLTLGRPAAGRQAALTSTQALSGATVGLYNMGSDGTLSATAFTTATTDTSGNFTISGVTAGVHYILKATRTINTTTYIVYGVVSVTSSQYGTTVTASDMTTETTFAVAGLAKIVDTYNTGKTGAEIKLLPDFSITDVSDFIDWFDDNLQAEVTAGNVSLTNVHTSETTLASEFDTLQGNVAELNTLVQDMSGASDETAPSTPSGLVDGSTGTDIDTQTGTTSLSASWTASTDSESGIAGYWYSIGTTAGATNTVDWTDNGTNTSFTKTGLTLTVGTTYFVNVKAENGAGLMSSVASSDGVQITAGDTTAPQVSSFSPASGTTTVPADGAAFDVIFNEAMDISVSLNNQPTLTASGFSITIQNTNSGVSLTIDATNALSYGTFSWVTTSTTNDTLRFTLKSNANLQAGGLRTLKPGDTYNITARTVPTNLKDTAGNALDTATNIPAGGSFTVSTDSTAPTVSAFLPANGTNNVPNDQPVFRVVFSETMDHTVNLNDQPTLTASGFSITIQKVSTGTNLTINTTNALSYGSFMMMSTNVPNDTLAFVLKSNATLSGLGLKTISSGTQYNITAYTPPSNVTDYSGNAVNTAGLPATGFFWTQ
jgi:hypothetical protein